MLHDLFTWLLATFVIAPVQAEIDAKLRGVQVPPAVVAEARTCLSAAPSALASRATSDPWWGVSTVISAALGTTEPLSVVADTSPSCRRAVDGIRPVLQSRSA